MNSQRFQRVREIYHAALDRPPERRFELVAQMCSGDTALQQEIQSLLVAEAEALENLWPHPTQSCRTQDFSSLLAGRSLVVLWATTKSYLPLASEEWGRFILATIRDWTEM